MVFTNRFRTAALSVAILFLALLLVSFMFRNTLASLYVQRKVDRFNRTNQCALRLEKVEVRWLTSLFISGITLRPAGGDSLLKLDTLMVSVNGLKLLTGRLIIQNIALVNSSLSIIRNGDKNNYDFLFRRSEQKSDPASEPVNYAYAVDRLTTFIFDRIPKSIDVRSFSLRVNSNGHTVDCYIDRFSVEDHMFSIPVRITENDTARIWRFSGRIDHQDNLVESMIYLPDKNKAILPFIGYKYHAFAGFDTVFFQLREKKMSDTLTGLTGKLYVKGFSFNHWRISPDTVLLEKLDISYSLHIGRDFAEIDSTTRITVNELEISPYVCYKARPAKQLTLKISKAPFPAQALFSSLPDGLFTNLTGIRVKGDFSFTLDFFVDLSMPDSLRFSSDLKPHQFRIVSLGGDDLAKINGPFQYTAFEKGMPVRTFMVGPENPNYRTTDRISPYLKNSVLTSEDPGFFQHGGFIMDAMRESLIQDIKERKFARGGSTISMQLVKNVFLSRNKTIARKLEEILLTWLIENQRLSTKERMFEVYMNIIEWGPLIYGANEASRFYFSKDVSKLTLAESIFLASIIPRPKWFRYSFDESGHLRESQAAYFSLLAGKMLNRGLITQQDFDHLVPDVELKGPARMMLKKGDLLPLDSIDN